MEESTPPNKPVKQPNFDEWTRVERASWKRGLFRARWRRRILALTGVALVCFALVVGFAGLTPPSVSGSGGGGEVAAVPKNETLRLTVPKMRRVSNVPVYTAASDNTAALDAGAIHVKGTGFPWEEGANVYIAGHRLGYPGSKSFLAFYDLTNLENGDEITLSDAEGTVYTYRVFREMTVSPTDLSVTEPVEGKSVLTLQTCTLPDYSQRLIVQAELVDTQQPENEDPA